MDDDGKTLFVNGEGIVDENMVGALASLLSQSTLIKRRLIFVRTLTRADTYKFSSRKSLNCDFVANLGVILRNCSEAFKGNGGGHSAAAGCSIPKSALDEFIISVKTTLNEANDGNDASPS
jgi:nanoRNase/pAp phosphatase (c-di-AMP/oligoRNAs hydrolase)